MAALTSPTLVQATDSASSAVSQRPQSRLPSPRRERPPLRSSPLAGPSYASDGAGRIVQKSSALDEEIARRRSMLSVGLDDAELARLASLSHSPTISVEAFPSVPGPSRQNSTSDASGESGGHLGEETSAKRKARPSFISLAPPGSPTHSHLAPLPAPPPLRNRHSSPNIARSASLDTNPPLPPLPTTSNTPDSNSGANWMTAAPTPSFSRTAIHSRGVVLPVKADSKSAQRIRRKSMPSAPASSRHLANKPIPALPSGSRSLGHGQKLKHEHNPGLALDINIDGQGQGQSIRPKKSSRSIRSVKSLGRMFHHGHAQDDKDDPLPPVPPLPTTPSRSRTSSMGSGVSVQMPLTPPNSAPALSYSSFNPNLALDNPPSPVVEEAREGKVKRLWARVIHGAKKTK
ncbi:hypothetical protein FRC09_019621 [Ceratobasidium sp. 395]|nr:hypothetical protein FRC09_019621 [Ceratobasidium sp. 395]